MTKYSKRMVDQICKLVSTDSYTVAEICARVGINPDTYHTWKREKTEFSEAIKKAEQERMELFVAEAKRSLLKKIRGYEAVETKTVYVDSGVKGENKPKIKESTKTVRHIQPDTAAIIFTLTNGDGANWKNRMLSEITGKDGKDLIPETVVDLKQLSPEEQATLLEIARKTNANG